MYNKDIIEKNIIKDIWTLIQEIKKCHSKSMYYILIEDLDDLYTLADNLKIKNVPKIDYFSYKTYPDYDVKTLKDALRMYHSKIEFYKKLLNNYMSLFSKNNITEDTTFNIEHLLDKGLSIDESEMLVCDFLSRNNKFLYDKFIELSKNHRLIYVPNDQKHDEFTYYSLSNKVEPYIILEKRPTIFTPKIIIHEFGHIYDYELTKNNNIKERINKDYSNYDEVYSHYLELLFLDFLEEQKLFKKDVDVAKRLFINYAFRYFMKLENVLKKDINNPIDVIDNPDIFSIPEYTLAHVLAYEFYSMFKEDKERTTTNIREFIINSGKDTELKNLNNYGLNSEKILSGDKLKEYIYKL